MSWHQLKSKYENTCYECRESFNVGTPIFWDDSTHKVKHVKCSLEIKPNILVKSFGSTRHVLTSFDINHKQRNTFQPTKMNDFQKRKERREFERDSLK